MPSPKVSKKECAKLYRQALTSLAVIEAETKDRKVVTRAHLEHAYMTKNIKDLRFTHACITLKEGMLGA